MIPADYINTFKNTRTFQLIQEGLQKNELADVLVGTNPYKITSQNELLDTVPSQVIIGLHILITENKITNELIDSTLKSILINEKTICLLLDYIDTYLIYKVDESAIKIDYAHLLANIEGQKSKFEDLACVSSFLTSIYSKIST